MVTLRHSLVFKGERSDNQVLEPTHQTGNLTRNYLLSKEPTKLSCREMNKTTTDNISLLITNVFGRIINLNGVDWSFSFTLYYQRRVKYNYIKLLRRWKKEKYKITGIHKYYKSLTELYIAFYDPSKKHVLKGREFI